MPKSDNGFRALLSYLFGPVETVSVVRYHLEKASHTALFTLVLHAFGLSLGAAAFLAWGAYLIVGKLEWNLIERQRRRLAFAGWSSEALDTLGDGLIASIVPLAVFISGRDWTLWRVVVVLTAWDVAYVTLCWANVRTNRRILSP